ncbi:hypothetical protein IJJ05_02630 [Candidatus Saccharibacteria bacterium]|nr:hypothetical protein [Candidatus Saccharibacteria bacterium]
MSSARVQADTTVTATASVTVADACTVSGIVNTPHTGTVPNGIYSGSNSYYPNGIGKTTLKVVCNDSSGYAIYAVGYTNNTYGTTTLNGINTGQTIATGTAINGANSNWAMKLTSAGSSYVPVIESTNPNNFTAYHAVPSTSTKVASYPSATDTTTGSQLETTYAVYVSPTQTADIYSGKVKYTLVHPSSSAPVAPITNCAAGLICYVPNASGVTDTMGDQNVGTSATSTTLWASNFKRPGYGFAGWNTEYDYSGTSYGPNEDITFSALSSAGMPLYAIWVKSIGYLQNWSGCAGLNSGQVTALTDIRDENTYAVAKLADGNCWMIENLRLDYTANISPMNTQNNNGAFGGVFSGLAQPETANFSNVTTANTLYKSDGSGDIAGVNGATLSDIGTTNSPGYRMPRYRNDNTNTNSTINPNVNTNNMTSTGQNIYSYGNYYTWAAAMANTKYYNTTTTDANGFTPSEAANTSLCPTGWKLPYGRSSGKGAATGGFSYLDIQLGGTGTNATSSTTPTGADMSKIYRTYPNNFLYSGYAYGSSVGIRGFDGYYWSSTADYNHSSYYLGLDSTHIYPGTYVNSKGYGYSIRCLVGS